MSEKIVQLNEEIIEEQIKELVRSSVEETLNELPEKEKEPPDAGGALRGLLGLTVAAAMSATSVTLCSLYSGSRVCPLRQPSSSGSPPQERRG